MKNRSSGHSPVSDGSARGAHPIRLGHGRLGRVLVWAGCLTASLTATMRADGANLVADNREPRHYEHDRAFGGAEPYLLFAASDGAVWFAIEGGVMRYDGWTTRTSFDGGQRLWPGHVRDIVETEGPTLWFLTDGDLHCFRDDAFYHLSEDENALQARVLSVAQDGDGTVWAGTERGIGVLRFEHDGPLSLRATETPLAAPYAVGAKPGADGSVWFLAWREESRGDALLHRDGDTWHVYEPRADAPRTLPCRCLHDLAIDGEGNLLVAGCREVHRFDGADWRRVGRLPNSAENKYQNRLLVAENDSVWVFDLETGTDSRPAPMVRFSETGASRYGAGEGLQDVRTLIETPAGFLLAGTSLGVRQYERDRWVPWPRGGRVAETPVFQILVSADDATWFLTPRGVVRYPGEAEPVRIDRSGMWPTEVDRTFARFSLDTTSRWDVAGPDAVIVSLDGEVLHSQPPERPILVEGLDHGSHILEVAAVDRAGTRIAPALVHSFRVRLPFWQRGDLLAVLLVSIVFIAAPSIAYAYHKHRKQKQSLEELRVANTRLQEAYQIRSDLVASVSHELRSPVGAIRGHAENLRDGIMGPLSEKQTGSLSRIMTHADRLGQMIDDLLDLRRIESGRLKIHRTRMKLQEVAAWSVEACQPQARRKNITVSLDVRGSCPAVWADRDRIAQVYANLIGNALKFTPRDGTITVVVQARNDRWVASSVRDTGPGIPPHEHDRIFDRFHQVAEGWTDRPAGAGLGLAICKELIELNGGSIGVSSEPGDGSTFVFQLPVAKAAKETAPTEHTAGAV